MVAFYFATMMNRMAMLLLVMLCFYGKEFISLSAIFFPCSHLHMAMSYDDDDDDEISDRHVAFLSIQPMGPVRMVPIA